MSNLEGNRAVVHRFLAALGSGDATGLAVTMDKEIAAIATGNGILSGTRGYDDILAAAGMLKALTKDGIAFEILTLTAEEDRVAAEVQGQSTLTNGVPYNNQYHFLFRIHNEKILMMKEYMDTLLVETTLGPLLQQMMQQSA